MIRIEQNGLHWLEFELLANHPVVTHGVFTRRGGCSTDHLASLNLGKSVGDDPKNVENNLTKIKESLSLQHVFSSRICHGTAIAQISHSSMQETLLPTCDALSTQARDIGLMILHADCQAAIFYDPIPQALANVHCGWRGNVQNIYAAVVHHMQCIYRSKPENLLVCISPSLGPENSEFVNYKNELPETFLDFQIKPQYFDLWAISEWQLMQAGILREHIQIARIDTFLNADDYFSYRRSKKCGRQATVCALN